MDLELSDDQRMLKDSVDRLISDRYAFEQRAAIAASPPGWSRETWAAMVDLGLTMLPFREAQGGLGLGSVEMMIVGEAFGRGLVLEPFLPSVVLAGRAIAEAGSPDQAGDWLPRIMSGEILGALVCNGELTAEANERGWMISGAARQVLGGDSADVFVLSVGNSLFIVPAGAEGLSRRTYRLHGGGGAADLVLVSVHVGRDALLDGDNSTDAALEGGIAFLAAEATGAMQSTLDITVEFLKTREQFGKAIGTNQVLQHRAVEMLVEVEQARSAAIFAALLDAESDASERTKGFAAVKAVIGKAGRFVAQNAVQLHGGIGVSEEHVVSHYFRRLTAIGMLLGDTEFQIARLADLGGFTGAEPHLEIRRTAG